MFIYILCMQAPKVLVSLCICAPSFDSLLLDNVIRSKIPYAVSDKDTLDL